MLITGREEIWLRHFFTSWCRDPQVETPDEVAEYVRAYAQPGAVLGACNDYRAGQQGSTPGPFGGIGLLLLHA